MPSAQLLDERSRPDFRDMYGFHAARAAQLSAAVSRIRLGGMTLGRRELSGLDRIRLLVAEMNSLTLASEADSLAIDLKRRRQLELLQVLLNEGRLEVRIAPLAGWSPDFSVFTYPKEPENPRARPPPPGVLMVGPHWFQRPYPHRGPALGVVLSGNAALRATERFEELWRGSHGLEEPITAVLDESLRRVDNRR